MQKFLYLCLFGTALVGTISVLQVRAGDAVSDVVDTVAAAPSNMVNGVSTAVGGAVNNVMSMPGNVVGSATNAVSGAANNLLQAPTNMVNGVSSAVGGSVNNAMALPGNMVGSATNAVSGAANNLLQAPTNMVNGVSSAVGGAVNNAMALPGNMVGSATNAVSGAANNLLQAPTNMVNGVSSAVGGAVNNAMALPGNMIGSATNAVSGAANNLLNTPTNMVNGVSTAVGGAVNNVMALPGNMVGSATNAVGGIANNVMSMPGNIAGNLSNTVGGAMNNAMSMPGNIAGSLSNAVGGALNVGSGVLSGVGGLMSGAAGAVGGLFAPGFGGQTKAQQTLAEQGQLATAKTKEVDTKAAQQSPDKAIIRNTIQQPIVMDQANEGTVQESITKQIIAQAQELQTSQGTTRASSIAASIPNTSLTASTLSKAARAMIDLLQNNPVTPAFLSDETCLQAASAVSNGMASGKTSDQRKLTTTYKKCLQQRRSTFAHAVALSAQMIAEGNLAISSEFYKRIETLTNTSKNTKGTLNSVSVVNDSERFPYFEMVRGTALSAVQLELKAAGTLNSLNTTVKGEKDE